MFEIIFSIAWQMIVAIFKIAGLVILSIFVLPAMLIMAFLHGPWEDMMNSVFTLDHF